MNMKRMRGRNHRPNGGGGGGGGGFRNQQNGIPLNRNHVFDSSGPEMRLRGTAQQLHEKYIQLARDASSNGDRVTGEAYYQHAEHYFRIISAINQAAGQNGQPVPQGQGGPHQGQPQHGGQQHNGGQNGYQNNNQNDYQNRRPQHQQGNGNYYQEPQENSEPRAPEPRPYEQPRQNETRDFNRHDRPRPAPRPMPEPAVDPRIDISSALEAELAAAAAAAPAPAGFGEQPSLNISPAQRVSEPAPEPRAIPISTTPPEDAAPVAAPRPRAPRGRPRMVKPEAAGE